MRYTRSFSASYVCPLCDTPTRLVWVTQSATKVVRLFVRQSGVVRQLKLPGTGKLSIQAASASATRVCLQVFGVKGNAYASPTYWIRITKAGVPQIAARSVTDWVAAALSPSGAYAAVTSDPDGPNHWVRFGAFSGRPLAGEDNSLIYVGPRSVFVYGSYTYNAGSDHWAATTARVIDLPQLYTGWERTWLVSDMSFRFDPAIDYVAWTDPATGTNEVTSMDDWTTAALAGSYADVVPVAGAKLATVTTTGTVAYIANPAAP